LTATWPLASPLPFADGNGRVTRLRTAHLLDLRRYGGGRFVSVEQLLLDTRDGYYDALAASTEGWFDDGRHSLWPWARYLLGRLVEAYDRFEQRVAAGTGGGTKQDRVRDFVLLHGPSAFRIGDIRAAVPGVSDNTIRLVLADLKRARCIDNDGTGRNATWHRRI
jgi:Fic family protein